MRRVFTDAKHIEDPFRTVTSTGHEVEDVCLTPIRVWSELLITSRRCDRLVFSSTANHEVFRCAVKKFVWRQTTTLSVEYRRRNPQADDVSPTGFANVGARNTSRDLIGYGGEEVVKHAIANVVTCKCGCCDNNLRCKKLTNVVCAVGISTLRSEVRFSWTIGVAQTVKNDRLVDSFFSPLPRLTPSSTSHSIETTTNKVMCLLIFLHGHTLSIFRFCSRPLTTCIAERHSVCCITGEATFARHANFQPSRNAAVHVVDVVDGVPHSPQSPTFIWASQLCKSSFERSLMNS